MASSETLASLSPKAYVKLQTPHKFFKVGRVFESDGGSVYVVVQEGYSSSTCCELQLPGQNANVNYHLPSTATLSLPGYPTRSYPTPSDNQYQLILECPPDEISPLYYFDFSKCLVLSHQTQVYKIGRVDRKSIKRLEAMFTAANTPSAPSDTVTAITPESTKMETPSLKTPSFYSQNSYNNPTKTNHSLARSPSNKSRSKRSRATDWSPWEYNADRRCYVTSRTNERGEELQYSGECSPPHVETPVEDLHSASGATYEPELKGEETFRDGSVLAPHSNAEPSTQYATMDGGRYSHYGILGYYNSEEPLRATSPPSTASSSVSTGQYYEVKYPDLVPPQTPKPLINAPTQRTKRNTALYTQTDVLPRIPLWKEFRIHLSRDFKPGYVLKVVWTEPLGYSISRSSDSSYVADAKYGELAYTSIRRFIIVASHDGHSICLPILTYGGQGTAKPGVKSGHHAIIYTTDRPPSKLSGEPELGNTPIRIKVASPRHSFDPASRINYAKVYTVEHNVRVCFLGRVHGDSHNTLKEVYLKFQEISFGVKTDDSDGHDVGPTDRDDEVLSGDDGTLADNGEASASGARNEPTYVAGGRDMVSSQEKLEGAILAIN